MEKEWIIRNFWLTNIELQKLKSEVTEDEYKYTINEAEKLLLLPRINIGDTE